MSEIKFIVGVIAFIVAVVIGSYFLVNAAFRHDMRNAEKACSALQAQPIYTKGTHYLCVTPDGRIVGHG